MTHDETKGLVASHGCSFCCPWRLKRPMHSLKMHTTRWVKTVLWEGHNAHRWERFYGIDGIDAIFHQNSPEEMSVLKEILWEVGPLENWLYNEFFDIVNGIRIFSKGNTGIYHGFCHQSTMEKKKPFLMCCHSLQYRIPSF